jgi:tetratricopeptide (TPR) repeat protein
VYSLLICSAIGLLFGFGGYFLDWWGWGWAILFSLLLAFVAWILMARRFARRLQPAMARVQKQMEAGMFAPAMESLEDLLPMGKWIPLLRGQVLAQMGMLAYHAGDTDRAVELLSGASMRAADARLLLACIHYKKGDQKRALEALQVAVAVNKKHALLHNVYAWMLHKAERADEAQAVLAAFHKRDANNGPTKDNLLRLQNRTRMSMQGFDMQWYALGLERPPQAMGTLRRAPKGFREPPKRRGG